MVDYMMVSVDEAEQLFFGDNTDHFTLVDTQELDTGRWTRYMLLVAKDKYGNLWGTQYEEGLTEMQEVSLFENYERDGLVKFFPVDSRVVTYVEYYPRNAVDL